MDKFLRLEFFKQQKFTTKTDGIEFIEQTPPLKKFMVQCHHDIEDFKVAKIDEFENEFKKYEESKKQFLTLVKNKRKQRDEDKKAKEKEALKNELRAEILRDIEAENMKQFMSTHAEYIPVYKEDLNTNMSETFLLLMKHHDKLTDDQKTQIKTLKSNTEKAMFVIEKVNEKLVEILTQVKLA